MEWEGSRNKLGVEYNQNILIKDVFYYFCVHLSGYVNEYMGACGVLGSPGAGVIRTCEPPDMGTELPSSERTASTLIH